MDTIDTFSWLDDGESIIMTNYRVFEPCACCKHSKVINTQCCVNDEPKYNAYNYVALIMGFIISTITTMVVL